jgi:hypothetical protein
MKDHITNLQEIESDFNEKKAREEAGQEFKEED